MENAISSINMSIDWQQAKGAKHFLIGMAVLFDILRRLTQLTVTAILGIF